MAMGGTTVQLSSEKVINIHGLSVCCSYSERKVL